MAKRKEHHKAILLRKLGKSYREIRNAVGVSKGTLSLWLKNYPLSEKRIRALRDWNDERIEHYRETRRRKREEALALIYKKERISIGELSKRDVVIGGLFLYWGEGGKTKTSELSMSNTDPAVIKAFIFWLTRSFGVEKDKITIRLRLYRDMNITRETEFWAKALDMDGRYFKKPYVKKSALTQMTYKSGFGHGTCDARLSNAIVAKRVLMGLKVLRECYLGQ
jgi:hypothetical protein